MTSKFFAGSSSESSSSDEEELYSEEEAQQKSEEEESDEEEDSDEEDEDDSSSSDSDESKKGVSKFLKDQVSSDESDDDDKVTVVKSAKDKRLEELEAIERLIENAVKINDWSTISTGQWKSSVIWVALTFRLQNSISSTVRSRKRLSTANLPKAMSRLSRTWKISPMRL